MKQYILFSILVSCFICCKQTQKIEELEYKETSYKFLKLLKEDKIDIAKRMFIAYQIDSAYFDEQIQLARELLSESSLIPYKKYFFLDTMNVGNPRTNLFTIKLFKNDHRETASEELGTITIGFRIGIPNKVFSIDATRKIRPSILE